jgi:hypothetical protein
VRKRVGESQLEEEIFRALDDGRGPEGSLVIDVAKPSRDPLLTDAEDDGE